MKKHCINKACSLHAIDVEISQLIDKCISCNRELEEFDFMKLMGLDSDLLK